MTEKRERVDPERAISRLRELTTWMSEASSLWKVAVWTSRWDDASFEIVVKGDLRQPVETRDERETS